MTQLLDEDSQHGLLSEINSFMASNGYNSMHCIRLQDSQLGGCTARERVFALWKLADFVALLGPNESQPHFPDHTLRTSDLFSARLMMCDTWYSLVSLKHCPVMALATDPLWLAPSTLEASSAHESLGVPLLFLASRNMTNPTTLPPNFGGS